jgi:hypothetical protein
MAADKMRAGFLNERFQLAHDAGLHAANVGDNRAAFQRRQHFQNARPHLRKRRAENDEIGIGNRREQVGRGVIHRAGFSQSFKLAGRRTKPATSRASRRRRAASPMEPPSRPTPMMVIFRNCTARRIAERADLINHEIHEAHENFFRVIS